MNERIRELGIQAGLYVDLEGTPWPRAMSAEECEAAYKKYAELIVRECIKTIEYRAPGQMGEGGTFFGEEGEGWINGYDDGLRTGAWLLKEHFGVE